MLKSIDLLPSRRAQVERAVLNAAFTRGVTTRSLLAPLKRCGVVFNVQQMQRLLDELVEAGKMFATRSMKQTTYHTAVARHAGRMEIDRSLLGRIVALLARLRKSETAFRVAHLLSIPQTVAASYLDYASVQGEIKAHNVGRLRLYCV